MELRTLWESKLMQSKAVEGFHTEEQQILQAQQQQQQQQQQSQQPQVIIPPAQQAPQQQVIVQDSKLLQHMNATGMSAAATAATLALPTGVSPYQQLITNQGQILQVVRAPNGAQYLIQPQQQVVLQQQVLPQMQPSGVQAPVIQQVLTPLPGGIPQQTGVIIQPQQIVIAGNKVPQNAQTWLDSVEAAGCWQAVRWCAAREELRDEQLCLRLPLSPVCGHRVMQAAPMAAPAGQSTAQVPPQQQQQQQQQPAQPPMMLQVDGAGDTSSEEDEEEEDEYDEDEEEDKDKDGGEDGQVEEEPLNSGDDVSDEEGQELFDTENVVVCQYDKIHRSKNKWKFHLKDGIMNLNGRDYVFSKAIGDAEW
uniref:General transcription factor IIA, 1 n=1 Tax=Lepisosteus oculatus TaxID=7918 RepID=W5MR56_LEPOC|nr:PREDICTED: transcription initiation factor IIA subunit 1 isoform X1 [Lepisosteus oculatus]